MIPKLVICFQFSSSPFPCKNAKCKKGKDWRTRPVFDSSTPICFVALFLMHRSTILSSWQKGIKCTPWTGAYTTGLPTGLHSTFQVDESRLDSARYELADQSFMLCLPLQFFASCSKLVQIQGRLQPL